MPTRNRILHCLMSVTAVSNNARLSHDRKMQTILEEIVHCMGCSHGSLMQVKNRKFLEVTASTRPCLIGTRQTIDEHSPSGWVVKHKQPLYADASRADFHLNPERYSRDAFLIVPIMRGRSAIGVLSMTEKLSEDIFLPQEQEALLTIAGHLIATLDNMCLAETLKKKHHQLKLKNNRIRQLEKVRTDLFNMLVHDLKGPLAEVMANIDILTYSLNDETRDCVTAAQTGCDTLYRMLSDLLDIARLEEGSLNLLYENIPPDELITESFARLSGQARAKDITFIHCPPAQPAAGVIRGDRGLLLRILQNLLTNALYHSPPGETIEAGCSPSPDGCMTFSVCDHGPGIPAKYQSAIFDKYVQVRKINDGRRYTTGLGLTFCKMAVEAHRGSISVESRGQGGSRFTFTIPCS